MRHYDVYPETRGGRKQLGPEPFIHANVHLRDAYVGRWTELGPNTSLLESTFGDYSYAAGDVSIHYADVGKFCSIASHVCINPGNHPMQRVTQHHFTYRRAMYGFGTQDDEGFFNWRRAHRCVIGHDVWLGHGVIVMPGVKIGIGAVVGSGAVVTKDVEPYTIVVGVPAVPKRQRFAPHIIEALLQIAWWEWDHALLAERFDDLLDVERFVEKYG
ncbi:MAG: acetyltransferase [Caldilineaceae bacterium]|nr:acetyltransferase [Caldilineaceae bacterium]